MDNISFWTYPLVFLSVLVPYLAASLWFTAPESVHEPGVASLPTVYRMTWRFLMALSASLFSGFELQHRDLARKYRDMILLSGYHLLPVHVISCQFFSAVAGACAPAFFLFLLGGKAVSSVCIGLLVAFIGWFYPVMVIDHRAQDRQKEIIRTLPFAIDLITSAMRAGLDFTAAVRYYVTMGGKGALAVEFGLLLRRMELGKSRLEALEEMSTHVQTPEFTAFVSAVAHGTEKGASMIDTLQIQGEDMRRARFNLAEQKAARAPAIMIFPIALFILPAVFTIVLVPVFLKFKAAKGGL